VIGVIEFPVDILRDREHHGGEGHRLDRAVEAPDEVGLQNQKALQCLPGVVRILGAIDEGHGVSEIARPPLGDFLADVHGEARAGLQRDEALEKVELALEPIVGVAQGALGSREGEQNALLEATLETNVVLSSSFIFFMRSMMV